MKRRKSLDELVKLVRKPVKSKALRMEGEMTGLRDKETGEVVHNQTVWFYVQGEACLTSDQLHRLKVDIGRLEDFVRNNPGKAAALTDRTTAEELAEILGEAKDKIYRNIVVVKE